MGEYLKDGSIIKFFKLEDNKIYLHKNLDSKSSKNERSKDNWLNKSFEYKNSNMDITVIIISNN